MSSSSANVQGPGGGGAKKKKKSHYRVDSTASAVAYTDLTKNATATSHLCGSTLPPNSNSQPPHTFTRRHKRTKSAGNYSAKDLTLFITTGLYAHNPMAVSSVANYLDQSLEHGFDPVARTVLTRHSSSDSDVSKREPHIGDKKNIHTLNYKLAHRSQEINGLPEDTIGKSHERRRPQKERGRAGPQVRVLSAEPELSFCLSFTARAFSSLSVPSRAFYFLSPFSFYLFSISPFISSSLTHTFTSNSF